jgi:hypothetical protein
MRLLRQIGSGMKRVASGIRKTMDVGEKVVNAVDSATGGAFRQLASTATGGMSERAITAYNANKRTVRSHLDKVEKVGKIADKAGRHGIVGSGAYSFAKEHANPRVKDYLRQGEQLAEQNPKIYGALTKPNFMSMRK